MITSDNTIQHHRLGVWSARILTSDQPGCFRFGNLFYTLCIPIIKESNSINSHAQILQYYHIGLGPSNDSLRPGKSARAETYNTGHPNTPDEFSGELYTVSWTKPCATSLWNSNTQTIHSHRIEITIDPHSTWWQSFPLSNHPCPRSESFLLGKNCPEVLRCTEFSLLFRSLGPQGG